MPYRVATPRRRRAFYLLLIAGATAGLVALGLTLVGQSKKSATSAADQALTLALEHQCRAANVNRAQDNASHLADYNVFQFVQLRFSVPTKTETLAQRRITREFAGKLQTSLRAKTWTALTDCTAVPARAGEVEIFQISTRQPPWYATNVQNAARPDPVGSVP